MKWPLAFLITLPLAASAQQNQCRTSPIGASTAYCASEAFVTESVAAGVTGPSNSATGDIASFADTTGKVLEDSGLSSTPATKAQQQTGTSAATIVTPSQQQSHPSAQKAVGNITAAGAVVSGAYNIASAALVSTGVYTVNFTTPFANTNYSVQVTPITTNVIISTMTVVSLSQVQIIFFSAAGNGTNPTVGFSVAASGAQ